VMRLPVATPTAAGRHRGRHRGSDPERGGKRDPGAPDGPSGEHPGALWSQLPLTQPGDVPVSSLQASVCAPSRPAPPRPAFFASRLTKTAAPALGAAAPHGGVRACSAGD
jgi:hypothetical protein